MANERIHLFTLVNQVIDDLQVKHTTEFSIDTDLPVIMGPPDLWYALLEGMLGHLLSDAAPRRMEFRWKPDTKGGSLLVRDGRPCREEQQNLHNLIEQFREMGGHWETENKHNRNCTHILFWPAL